MKDKNYFEKEGTIIYWSSESVCTRLTKSDPGLTSMLSLDRRYIWATWATWSNFFTAGREHK